MTLAGLQADDAVLTYADAELQQFADLLEQMDPPPMRSGQLARLRHANSIQGIKQPDGSRLWQVTYDGRVTAPFTIDGLPPMATVEK